MRRKHKEVEMDEEKIERSADRLVESRRKWRYMKRK
jgi:hypothetical protein